MGKLKTFSGKEICKLLEKHDFAKVRQRGSHIVMQKRTAETTITVPVPNHKQLKTERCSQSFARRSYPKSYLKTDPPATLQACGFSPDDDLIEELLERRYRTRRTLVPMLCIGMFPEGSASEMKRQSRNYRMPKQSQGIRLGILHRCSSR